MTLTSFCSSLKHPSYLAQKDMKAHQLTGATESAAFLSKHSSDCSTISGPWIENHRWIVQKRRPNPER